MSDLKTASQSIRKLIAQAESAVTADEVRHLLHDELLDLERRSYIHAPVEERYWRYCRPSEYGCWDWVGARDTFGYGVIGRGGRGRGHTGAHRVSWQIHRGPIPPGMYVLHRCDNPPCSNPAHLFLGTHRDNVADMVAKGRNRNQMTVGR